jgi:cell wall-associated NlpC family hydrolase
MVWCRKNSLNLLARLTWFVMLAFLSACANSPRADDSARSPRHDWAATADHGAASRAALHASDMVGKPYRYGGNSPNGFDCSGLVQYSYLRAGVDIPRTTRSQLNAGIAVPRKSLQAGDLVFFDQEGKKYSHVGIYIGGGRFVHAPSSGKRVRINSLNERYWQEHFATARRI